MNILFALATRDEWDHAKPSYVDALPPSYVEQDIFYFSDTLERSNGVMITGVGPINAALAMGKALSTLKKNTLVINVGLAGSFNLEKAPLATSWRVTREIYPEYGLCDGENVDAKALGFPQWNTPETVVWDEVQLPELFQLNEVLRHCPIQGTATSVTVAGVTSCMARAAKLSAPFVEPLLENMEGFSIALACARYRIPLLEIRTVSNLVGTREAEYRSFDKAFVAMGQVVEHILA